ncbi:NADH:ubiquinone oxidoreductase 24 [Savitreella phatthalungensis]
MVLTRSVLGRSSRLLSPASPMARGLTTSRAALSDALFVHRNTSDNNPSVKFTFSKENAARADQIISRYPSEWKKAAILPLLDLGQRQLGWTSISVMNEVARLVDVPPMRVYECATFYTMFNREKVGKYFLQLCTTTPCQLCGADTILETLKKELGVTPGHTTDDGVFTLVEVECAGACVNAPVLAVNDDYYEDLTPSTTVKLIEALRKGERPTPGPVSGRASCEPLNGGLTSLKSEPWKAGDFVRADL